MTFGAKIAMTRGKVLIISPARFAKNILTLVSIVISSVSLVSEEFKAPYGTLISVKHMLMPTYVT